MMANEKLCLRWTDFESNISGALRELREDQGFYDVTLACDEDQIQAHKVILFWLQLSQIHSQMFEMFFIVIPELQAQVIISACSPFFRTVLQRNPHTHPLLYLKGVHCALYIVHFSMTSCIYLKHSYHGTLFPPGVKLSNLKLVLDFMYNGEVNVAQEELNTFLNVAEELKVKGLSGNQSSKKQKSNSTTPPYLANAPCLTDRQPGPLARKPKPTSVLQPKRRSLPLTKNDHAKESGSVKSEPRGTSLVRQHQVVEAHPTTLEIMGDFGADGEEQNEDFSQIEGEAYYAQLGGDLNGGKNLPHVLVLGLVWPF